MPEGVAVGVEDGLATIVFVDPSRQGPGLTALLAAAPDPQVVRFRTRPFRYEVPESVARAAGLLDVAKAAPVEELAEEVPVEKPAATPPKGYDDGLPDMDWSRPAINEYAGQLDPPLDVTGEKNKRDAIDAIKDALKSGATPSVEAE